MLSFDLLAIFTVKCNDSVTFSFLFSFFFVKDQNNSFFSIKGNRCVFELIFLCVFIYFTDCVIATEFELQPGFRVLQAVN